MAQTGAARLLGGAQVLEQIEGVLGRRVLVKSPEVGGLEDQLDDRLDQVFQRDLLGGQPDWKEATAVVEAEEPAQHVQRVHEVGVVELGTAENGALFGAGSCGGGCVG